MKSYGVTIQMKSLSHGIVYFLCSSHFWVCWWSPMLLTFKWNLSGRHFKWYFLFLRINFSKKKFKLFCDFFSLVTYWSGSVNTSLTVTVRQKCRLQGTWKKKKNEHSGNLHCVGWGLFLIPFKAGMYSHTEVLPFPWQPNLLLDRSLRRKSIHFFIY